MVSFVELNLDKVAVHIVGSRFLDEGVRFSDNLLSCDDNFKYPFLNYVLRPFKGDELYNLYHPSAITLNIVFCCVKEIFKNPDALLEQSKNIARHLYDQSVHPKIKGGEFYTAYFKDVMVNGVLCDAVGLFKSENKERFLKVLPDGSDISIVPDRGVNIDKLDRGCLIFNTHENDGYLADIVDGGKETEYWLCDFLQVTQHKDNYFNTQQMLSLCRDFITKKMPSHFEVSKIDQASMLSKTMKFFEQNDSFSIDDFSNEAIMQPEVIECFKEFKKQYESDYNVKIADDFSISEVAFKKKKSRFKSIIRLDKNFRINIQDGGCDLIEQGSEADGRKFYKLYYEVVI